MKTRRLNVSEDAGLTITRRNTRSKTSTNQIEYSDPIPIDLIIEILSRLTAKSIATCRCVSKLWASLLRRADFTKIFMSISSTRPQLLFMCKKLGEVYFFSSPELQNQEDNFSRVVANYGMKFSFDTCQSQHCGGLVCFIDKETVPVICNPSTGQSLTLPKVRTRRLGVSCYFGYGPIEKQYKVLSMTWRSKRGTRVFGEHQILTLGTGNLSWRRIGCCIPPHYAHYSGNEGICISGVLYFVAMDSVTDILVCFDIRSEKFSFLKLNRQAGYATLVNYNGRLGLLESTSLEYHRTSFKLWVLEDAEKEEWAEYNFVLPILWKNLVGYNSLHFVGVTRTNEFVLADYWQSAPLDVIYYNAQRDTVIRVEFQGMGAFGPHAVHIFPDHVENVKLIEEL